MGQRLTRLRQHLHFAVTAALALALVPLCRSAGLEVVLHQQTFTAYLGVIVRSIPPAAFLYAVAQPASRWIERIRTRPQPLAIGAGLTGLGLAMGGARMSIDVLDVVLVAGYLRAQGRPGLRRLGWLLLPGAYFFIGVLLVYDYNEIIASFRDGLAYDPALAAIDARLLGGTSIAAISSAVGRSGPRVAFDVAESLYYAMFQVLGAGIIWVGLEKGPGRALELVGALVGAYYLGLLCFFLWPSNGPYALCPEHAQAFPQGLFTATLQQGALDRVRELFRHPGLLELGGGYYASFPCLHLPLPLIVAWFLKDHPRAAVLVLIYSAAMSVAVLLLEWHYLIDMVGGLAVAALVIAWVPRAAPTGAVLPG
jgi:hypothetical protein